MEDILGKNPQAGCVHPDRRLPAIHPAGLPEGGREVQGPDRDGSLALVVADTLPVQMDLMKAGLSKGQVGQRPFEMGYKTMMFLKDMKDGKPAPKDPTYTGLDVCTPQNATSCVGSGT